MDGLEAKSHQDHTALCRKMDALCDLIGSPSNGSSHPPSGLYHLIECMDKRLQPFEKLRERTWGAIIVGGPMLVALWWLGGERIGRLFHG